MKLKELKVVIEQAKKVRAKKIVLGIDLEKNINGRFGGLPFVTIDLEEKSIVLTTDGTDYIDDIESFLDSLSAEFNINNFRIFVHEHPGQRKDKDIIFNFGGNLIEIIDFVLQKSKTELTYILQ
jgi:hypothetical protein